MAKAATIVIIVLLALIVVIGGVFVGLLATGNLSFGGGQQQAQPTQTPGTTPQLDPNAGEYVAPTQAPQDKTGPAMLAWKAFTIPANSTEVPVDFFNPVENEGKYYLTFELRLADGESLYKSGLVKPGLHIQKITLSRPLPAGTYDAVVFMQPYYMDDAATPTNNNGLSRIELIAV